MTLVNIILPEEDQEIPGEVDGSVTNWSEFIFLSFTPLT